MTRKKETLTPEEKLAQTLVPKDQQPYELPKGWVWTRLGNISAFERGITFPSSAKEEKKTPENIICLRTANIQDELELSNIFYVNRRYMKNNENKIVRNYDILFSAANSRELVGKSVIVNKLDDEYTFGGFLLNIRANRQVSHFYLYYYLKYLFLFGRFIGNSTQTTNIANISAKNLACFSVPLPSLPEQHRIVARIESLFAKLDAAQKELQQVLDTQDARRAAILHEAFTGRLTGHGSEERRGKREENSQNPDGTEFVPEGWNKVKIRDICSRLSYGTSKKSEKTGKYIVIRMGNLQNGEIDWSNLAYTSDEQEYSKYKLSPGDVLFNRTNSSELVGKTSIYRGNYPAIYAGYLIKLEYDKSVMNGEYLNYYLNSPKAKEYYNKVKTDGVNQSNINSKKIGDFDIVFPSLQEQSIIVERLNSVFRNEKVSSMLAQHALAQIDLLKKSILARAFRGELGTQDPSDPDARGLLLEQ